ncbi:MAG TPA: amidohydrolase family protein [Rhodopila sp.]|jgi:predicted TIM-barrel fold metal-dependent hydrolase|nr:amidohydrolase family protein [Rhodopila sp.]
MKYLTDEMISGLAPAETASFPSPVPTQIVSSDEFEPVPQTQAQREVEFRLTEMADRLAQRQGTTRRRFFQTAAGMAASFVAINQVFGNIFDATEAEAATPEHADARAKALSNQFVIDGHTHFLRDDTTLTGFVAGRAAVGQFGWNKELSAKEQTLDDLKYNNYIKEIYMDSDTKIALLSNSPSDVPADWFIPQEQVFKTREMVNKEAGTRRMLAHFTITPGQPGWLDQVDEGIERFKPDSWKGYTVGDNTHKELANFPWHADDEKLMYPFYERISRSGIRNVCIHKGLFAPAVEAKFPRLRPYADVADIGRAAKDWPQLNFLVYHSGYRWVGGNPADGMAEFDRTGRSSWVSDLAEIPEKYGVTNVYGDLGQLFAWTSVAEPRLAAALMGTLVKGLGVDRVVWGTDAVWTGAPQWQIEGLRRIEIPEDMQKRHGFKPLGPADGPIKTAIFSGNTARLYGLEQHAELVNKDRFAAIKADYQLNGPGRSNLRYGYVTKPG